MKVMYKVHIIIYMHTCCIDIYVHAYLHTVASECSVQQENLAVWQFFDKTAMFVHS